MIYKLHEFTQTVSMRSASTVAAASTIFICRIYTTSHFALVFVVVYFVVDAASFISFICHPHAAQRGTIFVAIRNTLLA